MGFLPLLAVAGGSLMSYEGQQQGAKAYQGTFQKALREKLARRQQALQLAKDEVAKQNPAALEEAIQSSVAPAAAEAGKGQEIASAFASRVGDGSGAGYRGTLTGDAGAAATAAGVAGQRAAVRQSFADALRARSRRMAGMEQGQEFIGEDQRRSDEMLPFQLEQAGQAGSGLRTAGQITSALGMGALENEIWSPGAGAGIDQGIDYSLNGRRINRVAGGIGGGMGVAYP